MATKEKKLGFTDSSNCEKTQQTPSNINTSNHKKTNMVQAYENNGKGGLLFYNQAKKDHINDKYYFYFVIIIFIS